MSKFIDWFNEKYKAHLKKTVSEGEKIICVNPEHEDKEPSMLINENYAYCFGCGEKIGIDVKGKSTLIDECWKSFVSFAKENPAESFAVNRGYDLSVLNSLGVGVVKNDTYAKLGKLFSIDQQRTAGLRNRKGQLAWFNRVIIPSHNGYFVGRIDKPSGSKSEFKTLKPKGLKSKAIFFEGDRPIIIAEGETTGIALRHVFSNQAIFCLGGTSSWKKVGALEEQSEVWLCMDNDDAGTAAEKKILNYLAKRNIKVKKIEFSNEFNDFDDLHFKFKEKTKEEFNLIELQPQQGDLLDSNLEDFIIRGENNTAVIDLNFFVDYLIDRFNFKTVFSNKDGSVWSFKNGIYVNNGIEVIKVQSERILGNFSKFKNYHVKEIVEKIKRCTAISCEEFDNIPTELICVENGIVNLTTGEFFPHDPKYYFKRKLPINYKKTAKIKVIEKFLNETLYPEDLNVIQEWLGFLLFRKYAFKKAVILFGDTDTGKTTLLNLITSFLGEKNIAGINLHRIVSGDKFAIASLKDKYANLFDDLSTNDLSDSGGFKIACGGGYITAEFKFGDSFQFKNYAKHVFCCNQIPCIKKPDEAYYSRWIPLALDNRVSEKDHNLINKMTTEEELSGLLNYAIEGLKRLLSNNRFSFTKDNTKIKAIMERNSSSLASFAQDCLIQENGFRINKDELYNLYCWYCNANDLRVMSKEQVGRNLNQHLKYVIAGQDSKRFWRNVNINFENIFRLTKANYNQYNIDSLDTFLKTYIEKNKGIVKNKNILYMISQEVSNKSSSQPKSEVKDTLDTYSKKEIKEEPLEVSHEKLLAKK